MELEVKTMYIRYLSHEVRNPLNSLQLGLEVLEEDMMRHGDPISRLHILNEVKGCLGSSLTTLNDMLTSDKIRSGYLSLDKTNTLFIPWLKKILLTFHSQVRKLTVIS